MRFHAGQLVVADPGANFSPSVMHWGRIEFWERHGGAWVFAHELLPPQVPATSPVSFGDAIALDGEWLAVTSKPGLTSRGRIFVYRRDPAGAWNLQATIEEPTGGNPLYSRFGSAVAMVGEVLVVGDPRFSGYGPGVAYVWHRDTSDQWVLQGTLMPSQRRDGDEFGSTIVAEGNIVAIAAPGLAPVGSGEPVYVFQRNGDGSWPPNESKRLVASDGYSATFGGSLAISDGFVVVGDPQRNESPSSPQRTAVHVFAVGESRDICVPPPGAGAGECRLDTFGSPLAGGVGPGLVLSRCAPLTRWVAVASASGGPGISNVVLGGAPLCVGAPVLRVGFGQLSANATIGFLEPGEWTPAAAPLFAAIGSLHAQAYVAQPGGLQNAGLTNAIGLELR
jgi:hypothetical protein